MIKCIKTINKKLSPLAQEITITSCGITKGSFVVFADKSEAAIIKYIPLIQLRTFWCIHNYFLFIRQQSSYTEPEINYFRQLLAALATAPLYTLDTMTAINLTNQSTGPKAVAKNRAERLIEIWLDLGYLTTVEDALCFGPRCVVEFGSFLQKHFTDNVIECMLCKVLVLKVSHA